MRCLITGGAGFIASHLAETLQSQNHEVVLFDLRNLPAESPLVVGDIRDTALLVSTLRDHRTEAIFHLAALPGVRLSVREPARAIDVNVQGTTSVLEAARLAGVRKFTFVSSSSVYGLGLPMPFQEDVTPARPISPYAASKLAGEALCHAYAHLYNLSITVTRLFTVYGPRQRPDLAFHKFIAAIAAAQPIPIYGAGDTRRDYTYCADAARALAATLQLSTGYEIINIASGRAIPLSEVIATIEAVANRPALREYLPPQPGDVDATFADITKANRLLHYAPTVSLLDGIRAQWQWQTR